MAAQAAFVPGHVLRFPIFSPVERTAKSLIPRSTPTDSPVSGSGAGSDVSTANVTNHRPSASRETITIVGSSVARSMSGQDHATFSGAVVFASHSPSVLMRNAERV